MPRQRSSGVQWKTVGAVILILAVGIAVMVPVYNFYIAPTFHLQPISIGQTGTGSQGQTGQTGQTTNGYAVDSKIDFTLFDAYGAAGIQSQTITIYNTQGAVVDTLTSGTGGAVTSNIVFHSGDHFVAHVADGNANMNIPFTVPFVSDPSAVTTKNLAITLRGFTAETYNDLSSIGGTNVADGGTYNFTLSGYTGQILYSWAAVTDNKAILGTGFTDPSVGITTPYAMDPANKATCTSQDNMLFVVVSGNAWSKVSISGMDGSYIVGTTKVFYKTLNDIDFVKYKVGNTYVDQGTGSVVAPFDATGITDTVTIQLYIVGYANGPYAAAHSATGVPGTDKGYGPNCVQLAEQTISGIV